MNFQPFGEVHFSLYKVFDMSGAVPKLAGLYMIAVKRSPYNDCRTTIAVQRSPYNDRRTTIAVQRSPYIAQRSLFNDRRCWTLYVVIYWRDVPTSCYDRWSYGLLLDPDQANGKASCEVFGSTCQWCQGSVYSFSIKKVRAHGPKSWQI